MDITTTRAIEQTEGVHRGEGRLRVHVDAEVREDETRFLDQILRTIKMISTIKQYTQSSRTNLQGECVRPSVVWRTEVVEGRVETLWIAVVEQAHVHHLLPPSGAILPRHHHLHHLTSYTKEE